MGKQDKVALKRGCIPHPASRWSSLAFNALMYISWHGIHSIYQYCYIYIAHSYIQGRIGYVWGYILYKANKDNSFISTNNVIF